MTSHPRQTIGQITKRHGAWFIDFDQINDVSQNEPASELYNCASSQRMAKKVARDMATELGFDGPILFRNDADYDTEQGYTCITVTGFLPRPEEDLPLSW
jgi:hypothetical protein